MIYMTTIEQFAVATLQIAMMMHLWKDVKRVPLRNPKELLVNVYFLMKMERNALVCLTFSLT